MGKVGKQVFKRYAESVCSRRLLLDLGFGDGAWIAPLRKIADPDHRRVTGKTLADLGHAYEQSVYAHARKNKATRATESTNDDAPVSATALTRARLEAYGDELLASGSLLLLEHEWPTPLSFVRFLFDLGPGAPSPVNEPLGGLRPDLLVLRRAARTGAPRLEVLPDGRLRAVPEGELGARASIEIADVKHVHEQGVGRSHFIELIYYALALSAFLAESGLRGRFYVPADGHGILPRREPIELSALRSEGPEGLIVPLRWRDTYHLFETVRQEASALHARAPMAIESIEARIQPLCGRCGYVADCTQSLQHGAAPAGWDVALIPFLRHGSADQLRSLGFTTVGQVASGIRGLPQGGAALPIFAEVPALELKARALLAGNMLAATPDNTAGERLLSIALPRYSSATLVFDLETDTTNEVVFALGLLLTIGAYPSAAYAAAHDRFWGFWSGMLARDAALDDAALDALDALLDPAILAEQPSAAERHAAYEQFFRALRHLRGTPSAKLEITTRPSEPPEAQGAGKLRFGYRYTYVNGGSRVGRGHHDGERSLAERAVEQLHAIFTLSAVYEGLVGAAAPGAEARGQATSWIQRPSFAGFYWSREQLGHVQDLLERHLASLASGALREKFLSLLDWVAPSASGVTSAHQHRKVFDLREFVETSVGHPEMINVTWHGIDARLDPKGQRRYSRRYWAPHFNYMDFAAWHEYLEEPDANRQGELYQKLGVEIDRKLWALRRILIHARSLVADGIARTRNNAVETRKLKERAAPRGTHPLGTVWALYSKLGGATQALAAEYSRTTYPLQSIACLDAAEASAVAWDPSARRFSLTLRGLSTNVKMSEGDYMLLVAESMRDLSAAALERCTVQVTQMIWEPATRSYDVSATTTWRSQDNHPFFGDEAAPGERWFLYATSSDPWSGPLEKLLRRQSFGSSWLGHRLSVLWGVGVGAKLAKPAQLTLQAPEVYLYACGLLPKVGASRGLTLSTTQHPPPDPSQAEAIRASLSSVVTCIQGPPGTGKSQTIAALVDELLLRREGGRARVLVTASSYAAMRVVLDKVRAAKDATGAPTEAARTKLVWCRSIGREPIPDAPGLAHVVDVLASDKPEIEGKPLARRGGNRLDDVLGERFILFANAFALTKLGTPSKSAKFEYELLSNGFGFDLIVLDEASQVPTSQLMASLALVRPHTFTLSFVGEPIDDEAWPIDDRRRVSELTLTAPAPEQDLTRVVIVGDDNQLPPVHPVTPPAKLRAVLDSAFRYYVEGHGVPHRQLRRNYRSKPTIVDYTRSLEIYSAGLEAYRAQTPYPPLPPPPPGAASWVREVLGDAADVSALIHPGRHETAVSPLEAELAAELCVAFFDQLGVDGHEAERRFWSDEIGIVAPHNAQGRLVTRAIYERLVHPGGRRTTLSDEELLRCLRATIYSVEKFQGSDRTLIVGTVAISSRDQLAAEEAFIYDLNRFNVLTSRARQKMVLLCSKAFLDYIPHDREVFAQAARVRDFAYGFCDREKRFGVIDPQGTPVEIIWRHASPRPL